MRNPASLLLSALAFIVLLGADAVAVTVTCTQSGNWSAATTWGGNPAPVAGDVVIIGGNFTVAVDVTNGACLSIQLGGSVAGTGRGTLSFNSGSQLTVSGLVTVGVSNNPGAISMASGGTLTCEGLALNSLGTWTPGTGTVEFTASNTLPNNGITSFNNLTISAGTTTLNANTTVVNLLINPTATLDCSLRTLTVSGDWVNNGTFTGNTGTVIFDKNGNQTITGNGANNFNLVRLNMGTSSSNILEVLSTTFSAPQAFLTLSNGTLKMSGTFTFVNTFILGPIYNIQPTAGLWINNPNVTVTAQAGGASLRGLLRVSAGTYNIGTAANHNLDYVTGASLIMDGGTLTIAGHLGRNNATSSIAYNQSGGTVTVVTQGSTDPVFTGFDIGAAASSFTMSGGTIVVSNATSAPADYLNIASTSAVTGGTVQIGDANTLNAQTIRIQSAAPVGSLLVSNATPQATRPTAQLVTSSLNVAGSIVMQPGTTLNANGLNLSLGGDWSDNGTFTPGPSVTFNGSALQSLTKPGGETFNGLTVSKTGGILTLNNPATVNTSFSLAQGTLAIGTNTLTLNSGVTGGGTLTSAGAGTVNYSQGSAGQSVLAGTYGNLVFSNFTKTLAPSGTIGIAGTFTPGSAAGHTITGSTIDFNGGSQTIPPFTYNNLTLSGSGTKTGSGTITVSGNLTNNSGIVFPGTTTLGLNGTTHTNSGTLSAATLAVGSGATLTNTGTVTASTAMTGAGTFTQGATGILNIGGTADITNLNASSSGNTVNYAGASQTVKAIPYYHLTLSGSGTPALTGVSSVNGDFTLSGTVTPVAATGMTIGGNFTIGTGTSFNAGSFSHSLAGNWSNSGTFNAGSGTIILNGTSAQTMSGSTFSNLTINNISGVSMLGDETVANTLTLANGAFSIGAHTLTLTGSLSAAAGTLAGGTSSNVVVSGSAPALSVPAITLNNLTLNRANGASLSGDAVVNGALTITNGTLTTGTQTITLGPAGTLSEVAGQPVLGTISTTRNVTATSGTVSFGNIGVDITLNGVAPGNTTVLRKTGTVSVGGGHTSIKRYFDITPATNSGLNAGLVVHYDTTEVNFQNPDIFELYRSRDNGATWNNLGGTVNTASRTITALGLNDFSRWTVADTLNRIGNTAAPTTVSINPSSKSAGDPAFTLTVNGTEFVNGKSTVRFNGNDRTTTYVSSTQLTAAIPASDLLVVGSYPVTVFTTGGGGLSNPQTFTVSHGAAAIVRVETAADGSGIVVPAQSLVSGSSLTVYAITRDALNNFVANVAGAAWALENIAGGVVSSDLVPSSDSRSAVFTSHLAGSANVRATSGTLAATSSGTITVIAGAAVRVRVETAANGSGTVVPAESLRVGSSMTVYAITRDSLNNFVSNAAATAWSLQNITGGVVPSDLVPAQDLRSAVFTGHAVGSASILADIGQPRNSDIRDHYRYSPNRSTAGQRARAARLRDEAELSQPVQPFDLDPVRSSCCGTGLVGYL